MSAGPAELVGNALALSTNLRRTADTAYAAPFTCTGNDVKVTKGLFYVNKGNT
jgi:hypothetical protein